MKISQRTQKYIETGLADKQASAEVVQALESTGGGGDVTAEIEALQTDVQELQADTQSLSQQVSDVEVSVVNKQTVAENIKGIHQVTKPSITLREVGTGASADIQNTGTNNAGVLRLTTGSDIAFGSGQLITIQANQFEADTYAVVVLQPSNPEACMAGTKVYATINFQGKWELYCTEALEPDTYYQWNYIVLYTK